MASLFRPTWKDPKTGKTRRTTTWHARYRDADGKWRKLRLSSNRLAAQRLLGELIKKVEMAKAGLQDPFEAHRQTSLREHAEAWGQSLHDGAQVKYAQRSLAQVLRILTALSAETFEQISASGAQHYLASLRKTKPVRLLDPNQVSWSRKEIAELLGIGTSAVTRAIWLKRLEGNGGGKNRRYPRETVQALLEGREQGISIKTANEYLSSMKSFTRWMVRDRRMPHDPLVHLRRGNPDLDRRHDRQALDLTQLRSLIMAAKRNASVKFGLNGPARALLYLTAVASGFRARELACLTPACVKVDDNQVRLVLARAQTKNRQGASQPLPPDVSQALIDFIAGRPREQLLWPGLWYRKAAQLLRIDLAAAGISYEIEGPEGPQYADFHALRHSYVALLEEGRFTVREAMALARHSDPKLTLRRYARARLHVDAGEAVKRLPPLLCTNANLDKILDKPAIRAEGR